jgi:membrane protein DedA with SNARE-associated domain
MHWATSDVGRLVESYAGWAGPVLGAAALAESLVVVGAIVPATPMIVAAGGAIAAGRLPPDVLAWAAAGAFTGGWLSYEAGAAARLARWTLPGRLGDQVGELSRTLFARFGPAAVLIGRFFGPIAAITPFAAGWSGMPRRRFIAAGAATALLWTAAMAAIGYFGVLAWLRLI